MSDIRLRAALNAFLDSCIVNQISFEPHAAYSTQSEAENAARAFWERYCDLFRELGREPPAWPSAFSQHPAEPMI